MDITYQNVPIIQIHILKNCYFEFTPPFVLLSSGYMPETCEWKVSPLLSLGCESASHEPCVPWLESYYRRRHVCSQLWGMSPCPHISWPLVFFISKDEDGLLIPISDDFPKAWGSNGLSICKPILGVCPKGKTIWSRSKRVQDGDTHPCDLRATKSWRGENGWCFTGVKI